MPVIEELICIEQDGTISFGNYKLGQKAKKSDFRISGETCTRSRPTTRLPSWSAMTCLYMNLFREVR